MTNAPPPASDEAGLPDLAARLWAEIAALIRAEIALARAELRQAARGLVLGLAAFGLALALVLAAIMALTGAAGAALVAAGFSPAAAGLTVTVATLVLAALCIWWGSSRLAHAAGMPARTVQNLQRDVETLANMVKRDA